MGEIIELNKQASDQLMHGDDDMREDVCEHCLGGVFKPSGTTGECRIGPPVTGLLMIPRPNPISGQMEAVLQPWSRFPDIERRHYCMAFEPREEAQATND